MSSKVITIPFSEESIQAFKQVMQNKLEQFKSEACTDSRQIWKFDSEVNGVQRYRKISAPDDPHATYKGKYCITDAQMTARQFTHWIKSVGENVTLKKQRISSPILESNIIECELLNKGEDSNQRVYTMEQLLVETPSSLVSNREFYIISVFEFVSDDEAFYVQTSIEHELLPDTSGFVRATLKISGWHIEKSKSQGTEDYESNTDLNAVFLSQVDTGGWLPAWIVNTAAPEQVLVIEKYATLLKETRNNK